MNGSELVGTTSSRSPKTIRSSSRAQQRQLGKFNINSARTAWILSLLLLVSVMMHVILMIYHDEILMEVNSLEEGLSEDMAAVNSIATDAINAAYEYNYDQGSSSSNDGVSAPQIEERRGGATAKTTKRPEYSMEPIDILKRAGVDLDAGYVPSVTGREARMAQKSKASLRKSVELPNLEDIQSLYGNHSYLHGLDRCQEFRRKVAPEDRLMGPAGIFNSATNLLNKLLKLNCVNKARKKKRIPKGPTGMLIQAPWGKHNPVQWRGHHKAVAMWEGVRQEEFLPIVMIKDPITWMSSMCRHPYEARWRHEQSHCPNLVPNQFDRGRTPGEGTMGIKVKFATSLHDFPGRPVPNEKNRTFVPYESLVHLWNQWYNEWYDASFPRLMVRFEDLLFHAEDTVSSICACGGGTMSPVFRYVEESAKGEGGPHAGSAGFLASLVTYGNKTLRMDDILKDSSDVEFAREHLDKGLMGMFGYAPI